MKKEYPEVYVTKDENPEESPEWEEQLNKHDIEVQSIYGVDTPLPERRRISSVVLNRVNSQVLVSQVVYIIMVGQKNRKILFIISFTD